MQNYISKNRILFLIVLIPLFGFTQNFSLSGKYKGSETKELILGYIDIDNNYISDTLVLTNNEFQTSGKINGIQKVLIWGNITSSWMEDPNLGYFFLEPKDIEIQLEENRFKNIKVSGSSTQEEFEKINKKTQLIFSEIDSILKMHSDNSSGLINSKLEKIKNIELNYAYQNPKSSLSPYFVNFYQRKIPKDSLANYFNNLPTKNKNSVDGEQIKNYLGKYIVNTNDAAPDFKTTDLDGNPISLDSFKGKYLIIDFWAGWCVPCVKNLPELKSLYQKYNDKGLEVLGVSFDETKQKWKKSVTKYNIQSWNQIYVGFDNVKKEGSISEKYDISPIPAYILIDKKGNIIERYLGASSKDENFGDLTAKLKRLFNE